MKRLISLLSLITITVSLYSQQLNFEPSISNNVTTIVNNVLTVETGKECGLLFRFEVEKTGKYYITMWNCPIKMTGHLIPYNIYINGNEKLLTLNPISEGWNCLYLNNSESVDLKSGINHIYISFGNNIIPSIECLCISSSYLNAKIDGSNYQNYLEKANNNDSSLTAYTDNFDVTDSSSSPNCIIQKNGVELRYTFYTRFSLKAGDVMKFNTSSKTDHDIDFFIVGKPTSYSSYNSIPTYEETATSQVSTKKYTI